MMWETAARSKVWEGRRGACAQSALLLPSASWRASSEDDDPFRTCLDYSIQPPFGFLPSSSHKLYLLHLWPGSRGFQTLSWFPDGQVVVGHLLTTISLGEGFGEKGSTL